MYQISYVQIIYLFANAFRVFALNLYLDLFFSKRNIWCSKQIKRGILVGYYLINCFVYLLARNSMITIISNLFLFFALTIPYKSFFWRRIFAVCSTVVLGVVCEGIVGKTSMWFLSNRENILIITYILSNFLLYLVVLLLKKILKEKDQIMFQGERWAFLTIIPLISSIADVVLVLGGYKQWINVTVISCLFIINIAFFYLYAQMINNCEVVVQNQALIQQNKAYEQQISVIQKTEERLARLKHDYKNHMIVIKNIIGSKDVPELVQYIESMEKTLKEKKQYVSSGNTTLDGLINYKLNIMRELGVSIELNVNVPENLNIENFDGVVIIGNLMDNAIRALKDQVNGSFVMELKYDRGILFLHTRNSYQGTLKKSGERFLTTKEEDDGVHGIGLSNVKITVEKYNGELEIIAEKNFFDVKIVMYV